MQEGNDGSGLKPSADAARQQKCHELKTWPEYMAAILDGSKRFEFRKDDRDFQVGDSLLLREWNPETHEYSGRWTEVLITYILRGWDIAPGMAILSILCKAWPEFRPQASVAKPGEAASAEPEQTPPGNPQVTGKERTIG